jgi:hypothetical protein
MFQTVVLEKMKEHILCSINFAQKLCHLWGNVEKLSVGRPATDYHIIWHMKGWIGFPDN